MKSSVIGTFCRLGRPMRPDLNTSYVGAFLMLRTWSKPSRRTGAPSESLSRTPFGA